MKHLIEYIMESMPQYIIEGGQAGHMAHPFDYTDFTGNDLLELVDNLFGGKIEHMKEKLDGFNIFATMNNDGEVVFIRNKSNLNSEKGGMTVDDMMEKWADKEHQKKVFKMTGDIISQIFNKLGKDFFNPDENTRKCINCECIVAGKTNIMPYASDRVAFHGYQIYKKQGDKWELDEDVEGNVDDVYKAADGIDAVKPRPDLVIKSAQDAAKFAVKFKEALSKLFKQEELDLSASIEDWKKTRFKKFAPDWFRDDEDMFNRICNDDKSVKATELKKRYPEHKNEVTGKEFEKNVVKPLIGKIMEPIDNLFLSIGNELIDICDGFTNSGAKDKIITSLKADMESAIEAVKSSDNTDAQQKLELSLNRLKALGDKYNDAEGIVFMYKGRRMKLTGSFAPINQALGTRFMIEK